MKVVWTDRAALELEETETYIAIGGLKDAQLVVGRILQASSIPGVASSMGRSGRVAETREFAVPKTRFVPMYELLF